MEKDYIVKYGGLTKAEVLVALYNAADPNNLFYYLSSDIKRTIDVEYAEELLKRTTDFDYINRKPIKVNLSDSEAFDSRLYDRDQGPDAARIAILCYMREHHSDLYEDYLEELFKYRKKREKKEAALRRKQLKEAFNKLDPRTQKNLEGLISKEKPAISRIKKGDIIKTSVKVVEGPNIKYEIEKFENESVKVQSEIVNYNRQEKVVIPKFQTLKYSEYIDKYPNATNKYGQYIDKNNVEFYFKNQKEQFMPCVECAKSLNQIIEEYNNSIKTVGMDSQSRKIFSTIKVQLARNKALLLDCSNYKEVVESINSEYIKFKGLTVHKTL